MSYAIGVTIAAREAIRAQARYIAVESKSPKAAARWLRQVWDVIDGLAELPARYTLAPESAFKTYEVRRALAGKYLVLFTINEEDRKVWVLGVRHGHRLPRPDDLPDTQPGNGDP